jgi:NAD(P)-dependent dehydrogenase (short-subunit alcohol dehydrogenase family)
MKQLEGKTALITGSGSGIGRSTALLMAKEGARIMVSDINEEGGQETVKMIVDSGGEAAFVKANVADAEEVKNLVAQTVQVFGSLDIAVNNAGIGGPFVPTSKYQDADWDKVIAVNQTGVFYCMREELKYMEQQGSGSIVNIASIAGLKALSNSIAYVASKHAVIGMSKTAAVEYAKMNIRVNAVCPVFTRSPLFDQMFDFGPGYEEKLKRNIPLRRYGQPEDIANAILWLSTDASSFVTGLALPVDGGMMA